MFLLFVPMIEFVSIIRITSLLFIVVNFQMFYACYLIFIIMIECRRLIFEFVHLSIILSIFIALIGIFAVLVLLSICSAIGIVRLFFIHWQLCTVTVSDLN